MNSKHKHRIWHRAAAFKQTMPIMRTVQERMRDYFDNLKPGQLIQELRDMGIEFEERDRHPVTLEPLDGE